MKKPEVSQKIYEEWDKLKAKIDKSKKVVLFGDIIGFDDVYPLTRAVLEAPKVTGRSRKREDDLILVPRSVLKYLTDEAIMCAYQRDPKKKQDEESVSK